MSTFLLKNIRLQAITDAAVLPTKAYRRPRDQQRLYKKDKIHEIFPEYYLIKVDNFNDVARNSLDEWSYFLKNEEIKEDFKGRGLKKAKEELDILKLSEKERIDYEKYIEDLRYQASMVESSYAIGMMKGEEKGIEQGGKHKAVEPVFSPFIIPPLFSTPQSRRSPC